MAHPHRTKQRAVEREVRRAGLPPPASKLGWHVAFVPTTPEVLKSMGDPDAGVPYACKSVPNGDGTYRDEFYRFDRVEDFQAALMRDSKLRTLVEQWQAKGFRAMPVPATPKDRIVGGLGERREFLSS
ncbi:MAG: hypothetical protein KGJ23_08330 [Euryarchaeota archaeon]|nr:hypothetical protein [Euryarchaeota archaeon]MDE1836609.1 hypothetical protein [Euryarchaeota archaeon]MDE1879196.1 hypothetical protein [Euryarchaeota archaeon]MDE2044579.1 hypothetical protein [Thermoplasmata archaeon]